jgi:hypothetical protein
MNYSVQINLNLIFTKLRYQLCFYIMNIIKKGLLGSYVIPTYGSPCNVLYLTPVIKLNYYLTTLIKRIQPFHLLN